MAIPSMGAVLHTLNIRLFPEQIEFIAYEAQDRVVIVDMSLVPDSGAGAARHGNRPHGHRGRRRRYRPLAGFG